jgi:hypothetical protein
VSPTTGVINIKNASNTTVSNIRIGNTLLAITLAPGANYNYYFYTTLKGTVTSVGSTTGFAVVDFDGSNYYYTGQEAVADGTFTFKTDYWFSFDIVNEANLVFLHIGVMSQGKDNTIDPYNYSNWPYSDFYQQ